MAWDDPDIDWDAFDRVMISSTSDSVDRPREYLGWVDLVSSQTMLVNPAPIVHWGLDKAHQRDLAEAGIPVIPTTWVPPGQEWEGAGEQLLLEVEGVDRNLSLEQQPAAADRLARAILSA